MDLHRRLDDCLYGHFIIATVLERFPQSAFGKTLFFSRKTFRKTPVLHESGK